MYNEKILDHFQNPRNAGGMDNPDGVGTVGNIVCGDIMTIYIKVENEVITDIKFKTFGCGAAIASSSFTTELVKGKTIDEALQLTRQDVSDGLGGLPPIKMHCSVLSEEALRSAIADYQKKTA